MAPAKLSRAARGAIERTGEIGLSTISFWEIGLLHASGRLRLDRSATTWIRAALAADTRVVPLPVTTEIALTAGALPSIRDPGDSVIYATAIEHDAPLVTRDRALREHDPARTVW